MREERMLVWGLHCQRCTRSLERRVKALPGVYAVLVDAPTKRVIVVHEEARCDRTSIDRMIFAEGYDVIPRFRVLARLNVERLPNPRDTDDSGWGPITTISW
jgi:copper chaperone CopZ